MYRYNYITNTIVAYDDHRYILKMSRIIRTYSQTITDHKVIQIILVRVVFARG